MSSMLPLLKFAGKVILVIAVVKMVKSYLPASIQGYLA